jgi:hypothetical protein
MLRVLPALVVLVSCGSQPDSGPSDPGRVAVRRLNRAEYDHTVRDLLGTTSTPAADSFPADDFGNGFSNQAEVLSLSPLLLEMQERAADLLLDEISSHREAPEATLAVSVAGGEARLWEGASAALTAELPYAGTWEVSPIATTLAGGSVEIDIGGATYAWALDQPIAPVAVVLPAGSVPVLLRGPAALVTAEGIALRGPIDLPLPPTAGRDAVFTCTPGDHDEAVCAETIVRAFGRRAWRRPLTASEFDQVMGLYAASRNSGGDWEEGVLLALKGILVSPWFVYRVERDPLPGAEPRALDGWELASRLSYFLWATTPDDTLLDLADRGELTDPAVIAAQVGRMLADPRADGLVDTLGAEWLYLDAIDAAAPDPLVYPSFDEGLRASMREEMHRFTAQILLGDRPMTELLDGRDTFLDPVLAAHYGVPAPSPSGFAAARMAGDRVGLVSRAGWLTAVSYPTRTSPVLRGKWVLENLLCESPAPPPDAVPPLEDAFPDTGAPGNIQEVLAAHRDDPACASCHVVMDGIGFGLEHFDAIGQWREADDYGNPIDATGMLTDGSRFDGAAQLAVQLSKSDTATRCMAQKVFTFALGRAPRVEDLGYLDAIHERFRLEGLTFRALATAIATSEAFRYRTAQDAE